MSETNEAKAQGFRVKEPEEDYGVKLTGDLDDPIDVSTEEWRQYQFHNQNGGVFYHVEKPVRVYVKKKPEGDSHRVVDAEGITHYIPAGWIAIRWKAKPEVSH